MANLSRIILAALVLTVLTGCPWLDQRTYEFTSATGGFGDGFFRDVVAFGGAPAQTDDGAEGEGDTAVQRDVVEPDVIRRDGDLLYILNQYRGLTIVDLTTEEILAQLPTRGLPRDMYLDGDRAYVLVGQAREFTVADSGIVGSPVDSRLYIVDVATPEDAEIVSSFDMDGDLVDSRLVGDILYTVSAQFFWYWEEDVLFKQQGPETWITSVNVADPENIVEAAQLSFAGTGQQIHVNSTALFVAAPSGADGGTQITYVDITDPAGGIAVVGTMNVQGQVPDRFKMDAWQGVLRVVSIDWGRTRRTLVSTFDLTTLERLAEKEIEAAAGETLFATRFDGDRAYIVTFLVVDPLFVLDLSDPTDPRVLGELEVPGYSTHIVPQGDRLIALGVDDTDGRKVSVSIFDVSGEPTLADRVSFGENWSWSNAFEDVKAFTVLDDLIIVPFSGWNGYGGFDRLQFVSYDDDNLTARGFVDLQGSILRSFDYDGLFYGVTTEQLAVIDGSDLDSPEVVNSITLAEYVVDFIEVSPTLGVELVSRVDEAVTVVRLVDENLDTLEEFELEIGAFTGAYLAGSTLAVVGTVWEDEPGYVVAAFDLSDAAIPTFRGTVEVGISPNYWYYGPYPVGIAEDDFVEKSIVADPYYYGGFEDRAFVLGSTLALRGYSDSYDVVYGGGQANEAVALVNLDSLEWTSTVGLAYNPVLSVDEAGGKLYISTQESVLLDDFLSRTAYHIIELDVLAGVEGPAANVPGVFLQYDPDTDVLTLEDYQYAFFLDGATDHMLRTVRWDGSGDVTPLDSIDLPDGLWGITGAGSHVYATGYTDGYSLAAASIDSDDGTITALDPVRVSDSWISLLGAQDDRAYVSVGSGAVAAYEFAEQGELISLDDVMGTPTAIRFGAEQAYAPSGYFGLLVLPY
jgi:hypothetical protein